MGVIDGVPVEFSDSEGGDDGPDVDDGSKRRKVADGEE